MNEHFIDKCSCGNVILQCKCLDSHKNVRITENGCPDCKEKHTTSPALPAAIRLLRRELAKDEELFFAYQSNIAMAFYDEMMKEELFISRDVVFRVANQAAINFLNLFIADPKDL